MQGKKASFLWATLHSVADTLEEKLLLKFDETEYLFWLNLIIGILIAIYAVFGGIELSFISFFVIILYALAMVGGDYCYIKAIQTLPIGLANLIDSGSIFIILVCDIILGYVKPRPLFLVIFIIFIISIYIFSLETNKMKNEITNKKIDLKNIFILITSTIFYASDPYFLKLALSKGANEYGVNLIYYMVAIPVFYFMFRKHRKQNECSYKNKKEKKQFFKTIILIAVIFSITDILGILAYYNCAPVIANLIMKLQVFIVVIISVVRKTDKMNWKKVVSLIIGVGCIILLSFIG